MKYLNTLKQFINETYLESDSKGYNISEFVYHVSLKKNLNTILKKGFIPKDGISINGKEFENRLYFTTSLIAAYDLSVNFGSYRDSGEYVIFKITSDCIEEYEEDPLFLHGIYVDYSIDKNCIVEVIKADDLFDKFDENDLEDLYL